MRPLLLIGAMMFAVGSSNVTAQADIDPWDPAVEAAAERAAARLGPAPGLEIRATVLTIPALVPR